MHVGRDYACEKVHFSDTLMVHAGQAIYIYKKEEGKKKSGIKRTERQTGAALHPDLP